MTTGSAQLSVASGDARGAVAGAITDDELAEAKRRCKAARWPEHHSPTCAWCAYCASTAACARCNGTGAISGPDYFGNYDDTDKCPACDGLGRACCVSGVCDRHNALNDSHPEEIT